MVLAAASKGAAATRAAAAASAAAAANKVAAEAATSSTSRPEKVGDLKVGLVCLEHGKKDPRAAIPYEIRPIASFTSDTSVHEMLKLFGQGQIDQRSAQAAAWHLASKMSWQELKDKQVIRATGKRYPWFSQDELKRAAALVSASHQLAKDRPQVSPGEAQASTR